MKSIISSTFGAVAYSKESKRMMKKHTPRPKGAAARLHVIKMRQPLPPQFNHLFCQLIKFSVKTGTSSAGNLNFCGYRAAPERAEMQSGKCWKGVHQGSLTNKAELVPSRNSFIHLAIKIEGSHCTCLRLKK